MVPTASACAPAHHMAKGTRRNRKPAPDPDLLLEQLHSRNELERVKALHSICPCGAGFAPYERFRREVLRLQKDPSRLVRAAALHVEHDACEIELIEAGLDKAAQQGWRYSDADWVRTHSRRQATRYWVPA